MSNLPQNELLSAYLDGELTAVEQAEVERLLATNPAARQLLDELRALSHTLQSLPQEKLGEDLSRRVLRAAEQRTIAEQQPSDVEIGPVPLVRSIFRRFLNRRAVAWAGLAVAVAAMITVLERRQDLHVGEMGKEVARARDRIEEPVREFGPPPSIQATREEPVGVLEELERPAEEKSAASPAAEPAAPERLADETATRERGKRAAKSAPAKLEYGMKGKALESPRNAESAADDSGFRPGGSSEPLFDKADGAPAEAEKADAPVEAGQGVLVVRCEVSPDAAKKQAFDRLLVSNNIVLDDDSDRRVAGKVEPTEVIYVEASADQIEATLAGLNTRTDEFLSVSVEPAPGEPAQRVLEQYNRRGPAQPQLQQQLGRNLTKANSAVGAGRAQRVDLSGGRASRQAPGQAGLRDLKSMPARSAAESLPFDRIDTENLRRSQTPMQLDKGLPAAQQQRAVFVLQVVGGEP